MLVLRDVDLQRGFCICGSNKHFQAITVVVEMRIKCHTHKHTNIQSRCVLHWFICKREINTGFTFAATLINSHMSSFFAIPQSQNGKVSERAREKQKERAKSMNEKDRVKFKIQIANLTEYVIVTRCAGNFKLASSTHNVRASTTGRGGRAHKHTLPHTFYMILTEMGKNWCLWWLDCSSVFFYFLFSTLVWLRCFLVLLVFLFVCENIP